jgi:hypothetical protein
MGHELLGLVKFFVLTLGALYAFSVLSLANESPNEMDCFCNQKSGSRVKNINLHTSQPFAVDGTPISLLRWID